MADTGVIVIVGTRDADRVPEVSRGWGVRVLPESDTLEVCVSSRVCGRTLDNLANNQQIAVTITESQQLPIVAQVKGRAIETRSIAPSDLERITRHQRAFTDEVVAVGMPEPSAVRLFSIEMEDAPNHEHPRARRGGLQSNAGPGRRVASLNTMVPGSDQMRLQDIASCFEGVLPSPISTCSKEGFPNATYLSIVHLVDESHVALSVQFFNKTRRNILENPRAQVIVVAPETTDQYRMELEFERTETAGALFERVRVKLDAVASQSGMQDVFRLRGVDVYRVIACRPIVRPAGCTRGRGDGRARCRYAVHGTARWVRRSGHTVRDGARTARRALRPPAVVRYGPRRVRHAVVYGRQPRIRGVGRWLGSRDRRRFDRHGRGTRDPVADDELRARARSLAGRARRVDANRRCGSARP